MKTLLPHYDILSDESKMRVTARVVEQLLRYYGGNRPMLEYLVVCRGEGLHELKAETRDRALAEVMIEFKHDRSVRNLLRHWVVSCDITLLDAEFFFAESVEYLGRVIGAGHMSRSEAKAVVKKSIENLLIEERSK